MVPVLSLVLLFAAPELTPVAHPFEVPPFDWAALAVNLFTVITPVLATVFVWLGNLATDKIPRILLPVSVVAVASVLDWLNAYVAGHTFNPLWAAALGAAAVWLREFVDTASQHGFDSRAK